MSRRVAIAVLAIPVMLVSGGGVIFHQYTQSRDVLIEVAERRAAAGVTQTKLIEHPGFGHGLLVTERERVMRDLLGFLAT